MEFQKLPSEASIGLGPEEGWSSSPVSPSPAAPLSTRPVSVSGLYICGFLSPEHDTAAPYL